MAITSKDLARELNLAQPTVSRILNGDEGYRASTATRERVWEAARRLGYSRNAVASSLRSGRTGVIGLHTNHPYDARNDFYGTIIGALQCAGREHHLDLLLHSAQHGTGAEEMFARLRDGRVDGLILHAGLDDPLVEMLGHSSLPVVAVADALPNLPSVSCDDESGIALLIENLSARGYRDFVFLSPHRPLASVERRRATFEKQLQKRRLKPAQHRIIAVDYEETALVLDELLAIRAQIERPLAVCCWNDGAAYNLLRACAARQVEVPQHLAITGFDGFADFKMPARTLMTIRCPWEEVATQALQMLVEIIAQRGDEAAKSTKNAEREIRMPVTFIDGDTA